MIDFKYYKIIQVIKYLHNYLSVNHRNIKLCELVHRCNTWLQYMVAVHGCSTWLQYMVAVHGCSTWLQYMVAVHGCSTWLHYMVAVHPVSWTGYYVMILVNGILYNQ
jgi:hypothetical protein